MTSSFQRQTTQLRKLERVVFTRLASARRALELELGSLQKIEQELVEREAKVVALERDMLALQQFLAEDHSSNAIELSASDYKRGLERRYWINYDSQREVYYLELTQEEHVEQLQKVSAARKHFKSLEHKLETLQDRLRKSNRQHQISSVRRQDAERQDGAIGKGFMVDPVI